MESSTLGPGPANDSSDSANQPHLKSFVRQVLDEAIPFIDAVRPKTGDPFIPAPASLWRPNGKPKTFPTSAAPVELYERKLDAYMLTAVIREWTTTKDETWACRRSVHKNKAERGTASWEEFEHSFRDHHAESEKAFTPACVGARTALNWDHHPVELEVCGLLWTDVTVRVVEMTHKVPGPLKQRTFPTVQVSASLAGAEEFIVVSIPLYDFEKSPHAVATKDKNVVVGAYVAVERIRVLPNIGDIEWIMATASDARGILPQWVQNMAVPGAIAKDVELFISWMESERSKAKAGEPPKYPSPGSVPSDEDA